ncbi:hypothetical protein Sste5346_007677 [Sporothrix stenoceras]|uniref:Protein kinase domain-containing protein n=1 Tax=Sporothrix stenoceras TaxID=5173 RepID=A0ABR3YSV0_9PEZI
MQDLATLRAGGYRDAGLTKLKITEPLKSFPPEIFDAGLASTLQILDLSGTGLSALPADLGARLPHLRIAFFSGCNFTKFPSALAGCPKLEMVAFRKNGMEGFEGSEGESFDGVAFPPQLRWLILTDNKLAHIPASIGNCARLEKCMLAGNQLTGLPDSMANCKNLTLLRLAANRLTLLPPWLLTMPKLAFLSFAGNPCSSPAKISTDTRPSTTPSLPYVDWNQIEIHHVLGEGASGIISKGTIRSSNSGNISGNSSRGPSSTLNSRGPSGFNTPSLSGTSTPALSVSGASVFSNVSSLSALSAVSSTSNSISTPSSLSLSPSTPVAVKIFRGALTSDGTPYDEMAACLAAGQHVNLVQVHGQIRWNDDEAEAEAEAEAEKEAEKEAAPAFRGGLIMELIPPQYRVLGNPPSFDSCTRDSFDSDASAAGLPIPAALKILSGVASAAAHLHARGIAHGDLYAHNILVARGDAAKKEDKDATHAILSDFGAATLYGSAAGSQEGEANTLAGLEKLEVLAFAHLIEDVLGLMGRDDSTSSASAAVRVGLLSLHTRCIIPAVADRPVFSTIVEDLAAVQAVAA